MGRQSRKKAEQRAERAALADAASERAKRRDKARERGRRDGARRGCLICRRADGGFETEEHIFPHSLGNTSKILPPGVVCDRCNHEVCAPLDEALCNFGPIHGLRTLHQVPSKSGKLPSIVFDNGRIDSPKPGHLNIQMASDRWWRDLPAPPGEKAFSITVKRRDGDPHKLRKVHRAFVKQALEFSWLDMGEARALSPFLDHARAIVVHGDHHGYIATQKTVTFRDDTRNEITMRYQDYTRDSDGHPLLFLQAQYWGVPFVTDTLFSRPQVEPPEDVVVMTF